MRGGAEGGTSSSSRSAASRSRCLPRPEMEGGRSGGPVRFGPTGQINSLEPPVFQIQGGKTVVVFPPEIKQGELKLGVK